MNRFWVYLKDVGYFYAGNTLLSSIDFYLGWLRDEKHVEGLYYSEQLSKHKSWKRVI